MYVYIYMPYLYLHIDIVDTLTATIHTPVLCIEILYIFAQTTAFNALTSRYVTEMNCFGDSNAIGNK